VRILQQKTAEHALNFFRRPSQASPPKKGFTEWSERYQLAMTDAARKDWIFLDFRLGFTESFEMRRARPFDGVKGS
jgi:hypothetical protein